VNLGLEGRVALLVGEGVAPACGDVLRAEGARVVTQADGGPVDIVVAAGRPRPDSSVLQLTAPDELRDAWDAVVEAVTAYRGALAGMAARRWGRFVWIGTAQAKALDAGADELDTIVSLGMMGLHKVIAHEEGPQNVTANAVLRGGDATDEDVANVVAFLCSAGAGYLSGVTMSVDGGAGSAVF
jgi:3-oxoacyl-[acyl-carrier protein] reductase